MEQVNCLMVGLLAARLAEVLLSEFSLIAHRHADFQPHPPNVYVQHLRIRGVGTGIAANVPFTGEACAPAACLAGFFLSLGRACTVLNSNGKI